MKTNIITTIAGSGLPGSTGDAEASQRWRA